MYSVSRKNVDEKKMRKVVEFGKQNKKASSPLVSQRTSHTDVCMYSVRVFYGSIHVVVFYDYFVALLIHMSGMTIPSTHVQRSPSVRLCTVRASIYRRVCGRVRPYSTVRSCTIAPQTTETPP